MLWGTPDSLQQPQEIVSGNPLFMGLLDLRIGELSQRTSAPIHRQTGSEKHFLGTEVTDDVFDAAMNGIEADVNQHVFKVVQ